MYTIYFIASQAAQICISQPSRRENSNALIQIIDTPRIPGPYRFDLKNYIINFDLFHNSHLHDRFNLVLSHFLANSELVMIASPIKGHL